MGRSPRHAAIVILLLAVSCFLTNRATRWYVRGDAVLQCGDAAVFDRYEETLVGFVQTHQLNDGETVSGTKLPDDLARSGVVMVSRKGRYTFFRLAPTGFLADETDRDFVHNSNRAGGVVEDLVSRAKGTTYHIQYLRTPGWYYWVHN